MGVRLNYWSDLAAKSSWALVLLGFLSNVYSSKSTSLCISGLCISSPSCWQTSCFPFFFPFCFKAHPISGFFFFFNICLFLFGCIRSSLQHVGSPLHRVDPSLWWADFLGVLLGLSSCCVCAWLLQVLLFYCLITVIRNSNARLNKGWEWAYLDTLVVSWS